MKAWLWDGSQGISHLRLAETPNPVAKDGEAVMEVHYAALNPADRYLAEKVLSGAMLRSHMELGLTTEVNTSGSAIGQDRAPTLFRLQKCSVRSRARPRS